MDVTTHGITEDTLEEHRSVCVCVCVGTLITGAYVGDFEA